MGLLRAEFLCSVWGPLVSSATITVPGKKLSTCTLSTSQFHTPAASKVPTHTLTIVSTGNWKEQSQRPAAYFMWHWIASPLVPGNCCKAKHVHNVLPTHCASEQTVVLWSLHPVSQCLGAARFVQPVITWAQEGVWAFPVSASDSSKNKMACEFNVTKCDSKRYFMAFNYSIISLFCRERPDYAEIIIPLLHFFTGRLHWNVSFESSLCH